MSGGVPGEGGRDGGEDGGEDGHGSAPEAGSSDRNQASERSSSQHGDEEPRELTEEDILHGEAATWLQRTIRGHAARRRALFTPVWAPYPANVRPMVLGYQSFFDAHNIESAKRNHDFAEQIGLLESVLTEGLGALPHLHKKELTRPMVLRRSRASYLKGLVEFCVGMGDAYMRWGRGGPSEFMWQSAETLCTLPACEDTKATRTLDACNFPAKICYQVYAQDQLAMIHFKRGDYAQALQLLNKALDACLHRSVGRLPYFLLQSHKAVVLSAMGSHDESYAILEQYIPNLQSATTNSMGDLELMQKEKIVSHLLVISFHNLSVQLAYLQRWDEAIEITARVLSLVDSGMHQAQPLRRHFVHAHCAALRISKASPVRASPYSCIPEDQRPMLIETSSVDFSSSRLDASQVADGKGQWNRWLALAGTGRAVAPLLIEPYAPDVSALANLENAPPRGYHDYTQVLDAAGRQFPKLEGMEVCPEEVLGSVSRAIMHFVDEGSYASSTTAAADRFDQVEKLLDEDLFEFCEQLRWDVRVHGIFSKAAFLYNRVEDYDAAAKTAQRALEAAREQDGAGYHVAICQLCIGACFVRAGQHDEAFSIGKAALGYCHGLSDEQLKDETVRVQMENVLVGASHLMALTHIFLGHGEVALKLSKIAKNHIKNTSYYGNKSTLQFTQVSRVYEIAISLTELKQDQHVSMSDRVPKRVSRWMDKISSVVPNNFVPGALHRNLPELYSDKSVGLRNSRRSASAVSLGPPGEEIVHEVISREAHQSLAEVAMTPTGPTPRRYKWTGRYSAALDDSLDKQPHQDMSAIASVSMTAPLTQHSESASFLDKPRTSGFAAMRSQMSPSHRMSERSSRLKTASTPYGNLLTSGLDHPPDPSLTGHQWVDELVHGKEEIRKRYSSDPASKMYFAQVYGRARDQNPLLLDPLVKVVPKKKFVVGDHLRPHVGGARAPIEVKSGGSMDKLPHLLRDWGPDPTQELRRFATSHQGLQNRKGSFSRETSMILESQATDANRDLDAESCVDESRHMLKLDLNEVRVLKHVPYDSIVRHSSLGLFVSRGERHALLNDLDKYCSSRNTRPVTSMLWPNEEGSLEKSRISSRHGSPKGSISRPFHWSHAPEPSPFLHAAKGERIATNKHYQAMPYGHALPPQFKRAYGTNGAQAFGARSLQTVKVAQQAIVASVELSRKPETAGSIRSLSSFY